MSSNIMLNADCCVRSRCQCSSITSRETMSCGDAMTLISMQPTFSKSPSMISQQGRGYSKERSKREFMRKYKGGMGNTKVSERFFHNVWYL